MGCSGSVKVKPTTNGNDKDTATNDNHIRGDRLSIVDARKRREDESRSRLRRLSELAPEEVNKVRRNSSRQNSSRQSTPNVDSVPEEDPPSPNHRKTRDENTIPHHTTIKKAKRKKKHTPVQELENESENTSDENEQGTPNGYSAIKTSYQKPDSGQNLVEILRLSTDSEEIEKENQILESMNNKSHETNIKLNESLDSTHLRTNANFLVNDIMSKAMMQVQGDKDQKYSNTDNNTQPPVYLPGSVAIEEENSSGVVVDERARTVVDQILSNALFVVKNENT